MTLQHRACFPCLAETLLWEQAVWWSGTACPASPWDFSVAPLGTAHLPGSWFTQHPAYGSYIYQGPLFSSQVQWSHITLPQGALGDSFPSEGFTSEDRTALKKQGRILCSFLWWSSCKAAKSVTDPARKDMNEHCYSVSMVLCAEPSSLERIRLKHLNAQLFQTCTGCTAMTWHCLAVIQLFERTKILRNPNIHSCI